MKKFGAAILALAMIATAITACGKEEEKKENRVDSTDSIIVEAGTTETTEETTTETEYEPEAQVIASNPQNVRIKYSSKYLTGSGGQLIGHMAYEEVEVEPNLISTLSALSEALVADANAACDNATAELANISTGSGMPSVFDKVYVRRADTAFLSYLRIDELRSNEYDTDNVTYVRTARNYNSLTGEELTLQDVFRDVEAVEAMLPAGYLNRANNEILWTLDNEGVTFYSEDEAGNFISEFISFRTNPELFNEGYGLPLGNYATNASAVGANADVDNDGTAEKITVSHEVLEEGGYSDLTVTVDGINYLIDNVYGYEVIPVLACSNGNYYLYIECSYENDYRTQQIVLLNGDGATKISEFDGGISFIPENNESNYEVDGDWYRLRRGVFSNPDNFAVETRCQLLGTYEVARSYEISTDGTPALVDSTYYYATTNYVITAIAQVLGEEISPDTNSPIGDIAIFPGDELKVIGTDTESFVDLLRDDGKIIRVYVDGSGSQSIDGVDIYSLFENLLFAG